MLPTGLNFAASLRKNILFPCAGFIPFPDTLGYAEYIGDNNRRNPWPENSPWTVQFVGRGTRYSAVPSFIGDFAPSMIDVIIPDQTKWPEELWSELHAKESATVKGHGVQTLGIVHHLCLAMAHWSSRTPDWETTYRSLPFGSEIRVPKITSNIEDMEFVFSPSDEFAEPGVFLSARALGTIWGISQEQLPPSIPYSELRFVRQLSDCVVMVTLAGELSGRLMVFKASPAAPPTLYHELKNLLTIPNSPLIIGKPPYLVTLTGVEKSEGLVCGFLQPFYAGGTLESIIPDMSRNGTLTPRRQFSWAKDVTASLLHIQASPMEFYSDLRLDQFLVRSNEDGSQSTVMIDFEQGRNVYNWAPPEVYYPEWVAELGNRRFARAKTLPDDIVARYSPLLNKYLSTRKYPLPLEPPGDKYNNPPHGWYFPWLANNPEEREAGMVYMLGKILWCIFEGLGDIEPVLGQSHKQEEQHPPKQRFPEFQRTPDSLRPVIRMCTAGAREWDDGPIKIYRRLAKVYPLGKTGLNGETEGTPEETKECIKDFWENEMDKAERFLETRIKYDRGGTLSNEELDLLQYLKRPKLHEVAHALEQAGEFVW